jgi:hypothetical protein
MPAMATTSSAEIAARAGEAFSRALELQRTYHRTKSTLAETRQELATRRTRTAPDEPRAPAPQA